MSQSVVRRKDKEMSRVDVDRFLGEAALAHFATMSANGDPYVVPNLFVYADGLIYLHTSLGGHFRDNVEARPRISFEAAEMGTVFPYGEFECDSSVSFTSVVGFGAVRIDADPAGKARFFDRLMAKYADPKWQRPKSFYPRLDMVTVYAIEIERVTGKRGPLLAVGDQWPARNLTKSPGAVALRRN
jgi:uncharacterized protein